MLVLNELGLDPGIDHMSAMQVIDDIREQGGTMIRFASYCGGLVAPPRTTIPGTTSSVGIHETWCWQAGWLSDVSEQGRLRVVPPHRLPKSGAREVEGRAYDGYPNRDSLSYQRPMGFKRWRPWFGERFGRLASANPGTFGAIGHVRDDASVAGQRAFRGPIGHIPSFPLRWNKARMCVRR